MAGCCCLLRSSRSRSWNWISSRSSRRRGRAPLHKSYLPAAGQSSGATIATMMMSNPIFNPAQLLYAKRATAGEIRGERTGMRRQLQSSAGLPTLRFENLAMAKDRLAATSAGVDARTTAGLEASATWGRCRIGAWRPALPRRSSRVSSWAAATSVGFFVATGAKAGTSHLLTPRCIWLGSNSGTDG